MTKWFVAGHGEVHHLQQIGSLIIWCIVLMNRRVSHIKRKPFFSLKKKVVNLPLGTVISNKHVNSRSTSLFLFGFVNLSYDVLREKRINHKLLQNYKSVSLGIDDFLIIISMVS